MPETREIWVAPGGLGEIVRRQTESTFPTPEDERIWEASGRRPKAQPSEAVERTSADLRATPWGQTDEFPTDVDELLERIRRIAAGSGDQPRDVSAFQIASDLLMAPDASPRLRASLFQVLGRLDGVRALGRDAIEGGQTGDAVGLTYDSSGVATRVRIVFDSDTARVLGTATEMLEVPAALHGTAPLLIAYTKLEQSATVARVGRRP